MTATRKTWTAFAADQATEKADALSLRAHGLTQVLRVCAFAAEARRALSSLEDALEHRPAVRDDLHDHAHLNGWDTLPDASADALLYVASELSQAMEEGVKLSYRLARHLREHGERAEAAERGEAES